MSPELMHDFPNIRGALDVDRTELKLARYRRLGVYVARLRDLDTCEDLEHATGTTITEALRALDTALRNRFGVRISLLELPQ